jgi:hypothetical protein
MFGLDPNTSGQWGSGATAVRLFAPLAASDAERRPARKMHATGRTAMTALAPNGIN